MVTGASGSPFTGSSSKETLRSWGSEGAGVWAGCGAACGAACD